MKIKEVSSIKVTRENGGLVKDGFVDVHDAYEYVVNNLDNDEKGNTLVIKEEITIKRIQ